MFSLLDNIRGINEVEENKEEEKKEEKNEEKNEEKKEEKMKLLSQGTYGCVFRPGIECSSNQLTTKKYITKVQKSKKTSAHEVEIGKEIKKIRGYASYYAPIIESCKLKLGDINNEEDIKKCKIIENVELKEEKYESNKIPYVGKSTLLERVYEDTKNIRGIESYFKRYIDKHVVLLKGIEKLNEAGIMHLDLKENNIMCRDKSGRPILIDFGLSVNTKKLEKGDIEVKEPFFSYSVEYGPWCMDILMVMYMVNETKNAKINQEKKEAWRDENATMEEMKKVVREYMEKNVAILEILSSEEQEKYKKEMEEYYSPLITGGMMNMPTWGSVYDEIIKNNKSWDNYGLAVIFLEMLKILGLTDVVNKIPFMRKYLEIMKKIIISMPDKRPTADETRKEIEKEMRKVKREEKKEMKKILEKDLINVEKNEERNKSVIEKKLLTLNEKEVLRKKIIE
jgi:serine/threonine protein kinase